MIKRIVLWLLAAFGIVAAVLVVFALLQPPERRRPAIRVAYSDLLTLVAGGGVRGVVVQGHVLTGTGQDGRAFESYVPDDPALPTRLAGQGVNVVVASPDGDDSPLLHLALGWLPIVIYLVAIVVPLRRIGVELRALRRAMEASGARGPAVADSS